MNIQFYSQNADLTKELKNYARKKIIKSFRFFNKIKEVHIEFESDAHHNQGEDVKRVFFTAYVPRDVIRIEEAGTDFKQTIDLLIPKLKHQIKKYKEKQQTLARKNERIFKKALRYATGKIKPQTLDEQYIPKFDIVKRKKFALAETMNEDKAIEEMNRLGHDFYVFIDNKSGQNAIVYKRIKGGYGVIYTSS